MLQLERNLAIQKLILEGKTYEEIAKQYNITRQRIYAIAKRDYSKAILRESIRESFKNTHNHTDDVSFKYCPICGKSLYDLPAIQAEQVIKEAIQTTSTT